MISPNRSLVLGVLLMVTMGSRAAVAAEQPKTSPAVATQPAVTPPVSKGTPAPTIPAKSAPVEEVPAVPATASSTAPTKAKAEPTAPVVKAAETAPPRKAEQPVVEAAAEVPAAPAPAPPTVTAPAGMPREPSIYETGRVGKMGVSDSGVRIKQTQERPKPKEQRIEEKAITPESVAGGARPAGALNQAVFGRELRPRFALLRDCRIEVARQKRTEISALAGGHLILRWTVLPNGSVTDTQVVAMSPVDGRVTDCIKRQMSLWSFSPPTGGPARVERPFKFQ